MTSRHAGNGQTPPGLTDRQEQLLRRMKILAWANVAIGLVGLVFLIADLDAATWIVAGVVIVALVAGILVGRSLTRTGPPFEGVRWWFPWGGGVRAAKAKAPRKKSTARRRS